MNLRDLQYLVAVHDTHSFSKAADKCHVSQPTLSGQLKKLEDELGTSLIERSTRQVLFTDLGEQIVLQARQILRTADHIRELAKQGTDPMHGDFHLGLIPTVGPFLLPVIMPVLNQTFPNAKLFLYEMKTEVLLDDLIAGKLDAVILAKLDWQSPVQELPLYSEAMKLAVAKTDRIAEADGVVALSVLNGRSVLMLEDGHCLREQALGVCFSAGANEDKRFQATSMDTLLHMVGTGAGITLIPELATRSTYQDVVFMSFSRPQPQRDIVMLTRRKSVRTDSLVLLAAVIRNAVAETGLLAQKPELKNNLSKQTQETSS